jgi:hypothetical protein
MVVVPGLHSLPRSSSLAIPTYSGAENQCTFVRVGTRPDVSRIGKQAGTIRPGVFSLSDRAGQPLTCTRAMRCADRSSLHSSQFFIHRVGRSRTADLLLWPGQTWPAVPDESGAASGRSNHTHTGSALFITHASQRGGSGGIIAQPDSTWPGNAIFFTMKRKSLHMGIIPAHDDLENVV